MGARSPIGRRAMTRTASPSIPLQPSAWLPADAVEVWHEIEPRLRVAGSATGTPRTP